MGSLVRVQYRPPNQPPFTGGFFLFSKSRLLPRLVSHRWRLTTGRRLWRFQAVGNGSSPVQTTKSATLHGWYFLFFKSCPLPRLASHRWRLSTGRRLWRFQAVGNGSSPVQTTKSATLHGWCFLFSKSCPLPRLASHRWRLTTGRRLWRFQAVGNGSSPVQTTKRRCLSWLDSAILRRRLLILSPNPARCRAATCFTSMTPRALAPQ